MAFLALSATWVTCLLLGTLATQGYGQPSFAATTWATESSSAGQPEKVPGAAHAGPDVRQLFASEGFTYLGKVFLAPTLPTGTRRTAAKAALNSSSSRLLIASRVPTASPQKVEVYRVTPPGNLYVAKYEYRPTGKAPTPPNQRPNATNVWCKGAVTPPAATQPTAPGGQAPRGLKGADGPAGPASSPATAAVPGRSAAAATCPAGTVATAWPAAVVNSSFCNTDPNNLPLRRLLQATEQQQHQQPSVEQPYPQPASPFGTNLGTWLQRHLTTIIGTDDRKNCTQGKWPFLPVGQLDINDDVGGEICTGVLVGPDRVLTAAHCVWNELDSTFVRGLSFSPGRYRQGCKVVSPHGTIPWAHATIFRDYADKLRPDIAIIKLAIPIGNKVGWLGMKPACPQGTNGTTLSLIAAGYPKSKTTGRCETSSCKVPISDCNAIMIDHTCDTMAGQSGAPLWDGQGFVRMVHNVGDLYDNDGKLANLGTPLTRFIYENVANW